MRELTVAAIQIACSDDIPANLDKIESLARTAVRRGAKLVVLQELFEGSYFCKDEDGRHRARAKPMTRHPSIERMSRLARELCVVLPVSFYELDGERRFNSLVMIDADGRVLGHYRKSHIPNSPGYSEKYYFSDGDTGFIVHETAVGRVEIGRASCRERVYVLV